MSVMEAPQPVVEGATNGAGAIEAAMVFSLSERGILEVEGPLRAKFLQGLLSNDVVRLKAGQGCAAALMNVKGHVLALVRALAAEDRVILEVNEERLDRVQAMLEHFRVAAPVRFKKAVDRVVAVVGPKARDILASLAGNVPEAANDHRIATIAGGPVRLIRAGDLPRESFVLHVSPEHVEGVIEALTAGGAGLADHALLDALRVEAGIPWYGPDVTEDNLLHETGLVPTHHSSTKGCYLGQEVIARLEARGGNVNKALRRLRLSSPARPGDAVTSDGKDVGRVTTAGVSNRLGPIALAYVHRSAFTPGTRVRVGGAEAVVEPAVPAIR